ncbi:hypothetical protein KA005_38495 [bacterium]|nr:hypothetical protein [bacterium]
MLAPYYETENGKLYYGDNLKIMPELDSVDLIYTDPPYNVGKGYGPGQDKLPEKEYLNRMYDVFELCFKLSNKVILHISKKHMTAYLNLLPEGNLIILRRGSSGTFAFPFRWSDHFDILWSYGHPKKAPSNLWTGIRLAGEGWFFREDRFGHRGYTPQPIAIKAIDTMTDDNDIVLDCFSGTGTTLLACERFNRKWIGIEYEEKNCEITAKRIESERSQLKLFRRKKQ